MPTKKKATTKKKPAAKKKPASRKKLIKIVTIKITKGKTTGGIELGVCYEKRNCQGKRLSGTKVEKGKCKDPALNGKSWDGDKSGCVNL